MAGQLPGDKRPENLKEVRVGEKTTATWMLSCSKIPNGVSNKE